MWHKTNRVGGHWAWLILIAPFLLVAHLLNDLHSAMVTFHGTDELIFHVPAILKFATQWPVPLVGDYSSATTPLFHLLFSLIGEAIGFELYKLRAVNALISFMAVGVYYKMWRHQFGHGRDAALLMTLAFLMSPYFFGVSFLLLTDNLAWLFCLLAMYCFLDSVRTGQLSTWVLACVFLGLALLTRQSLIWLMGSAAALAWIHATSLRARLARIAWVLAAGVPLAMLVLKWHGLVPPSFQHLHETDGTLNLRAIEFALALVGLYLPLLSPAEFKRAWASSLGWALAAVLLGAVLLLVLPVGQSIEDDGIVWRLSRSGPTLAGTPLLLWVLVPLGCVGLMRMLRVSPTSLGTLSLLAFLVAMLPFSRLHQKYFDPFIPLFIWLAFGQRRWPDPAARRILIGLIVGFSLYAYWPYSMLGGQAGLKAPLVDGS